MGAIALAGLDRNELLPAMIFYYCFVTLRSAIYGLATTLRGS